uniref:Solute carrier family 3 member 2a n=2 Tax=Takifugu rubripes TaxID=31033 RepID=H2US53_TAKRU
MLVLHSSVAPSKQEPASTMIEVDMKEVELSEMDPEKQPMTGDGQAAAAAEKNGSVKLKVPEDEVAFTGLSKDELMKVAGTPGWVRTRFVLLILFWLGWIGMLAGAIVIIVQAPRCKPIPEMNWWNEGPLYEISDTQAFSDGLKGIESKLDNINQLKVKGLVLGPLHTVQANQPSTLDLEKFDPRQGTNEELLGVLEKAHRKGINVMLDLTPNYLGSSSWFNPVEKDVRKVEAAAEYWLGLGVDGIKVSDLAIASGSAEWAKLQDVVQKNSSQDGKRRALMGVVKNVSATSASQLLNTSGVDLLQSDLVSTNIGGSELINTMDTLNSEQRSLGWGFGEQLSKQAKTPGLIRLYHLLLFTLPGTPIFKYGDEIGLPPGQGSEPPKMIWDLEKEPAEGEADNGTVKTETLKPGELRNWFISLSDLRGKERSLLHGDYYSLSSSDTSLAFLRLWDQSERYITAVNWGTAPETLAFKLATPEVKLPETAKVKLSTDDDLKEESDVSLEKLTLGAGKAVLLQFPYKG